MAEGMEFGLGWRARRWTLVQSHIPAITVAGTATRMKIQMRQEGRRDALWLVKELLYIEKYSKPKQKTFERKPASFDSRDRLRHHRRSSILKAVKET